MDNLHFEEFLKNEYANISQAHFKSIDTISSFFRYYLIIMTVPITAAVALYKFFQTNQNTAIIDASYTLPVSLMFILIFFIGVGMCAHIINLRLDCILYARTINGIRKLYYDAADINLNDKIRYRVLPQSPFLPSYHEKSYFWPVIFVFGIINSSYLLIALSVYLNNFNNSLILEENIFKVSSYAEAIAIYFIPTILLHYLFYFAYTLDREYAYLKSNIIGVDIDGVLNEHRSHFSLMLAKSTGKSLRPEDIYVIPVHEIPNTTVTRDDELSVFNDPDYWINMPAKEKAAEIIKKLRNIYRYKIYVFTHRDWPMLDDKDKLAAINLSFRQRLKDCKDDTWIFTLWAKYFGHAIKLITVKWLKKNNFQYDKIFFEHGNDVVSYPRVHFNNRFNHSRKKTIKYFIEDDINKAIKLSFICDVIFLIEHPYNIEHHGLPATVNERRRNIPSNIIRVTNWQDIYEKIRTLS